MDLSTPIRSAGRSYSIFANKLEKLNIRKLEDFLYHIPHRYENFSLVSKIAQAQPGEVVTIQGTVKTVMNQFAARRFKLQKVRVTDDTGSIECIWFNQPYVLKTLNDGDVVSVSGKVGTSGRLLSVQVKDYEIIMPDRTTTHTGGFIPVYPETKGLSSKYLRNRIKQMLAEYTFEDFLPEEIKKKYKFLDLPDALHNIHFPKNEKIATVARDRLAFDELFLAQLSGLKSRKEWKEQTVGHIFEVKKYQKKIEKLLKSLPFTLTSAQQKAVEDILSDISTENPMNRLLQGDVGSGKTIVAAVAQYVVHLNGFQSAFLAPTQILAEQHNATITRILEPFGLRVGIITSNKKSDLKGEKFDIVVGTHALLRSGIEFDKLGFVAIDEQQRFGVEQRAILRGKGTNPHFLTMTATPIPRTIFLTIYGDLDVSYLNEMPKGRQIVKTWLVPEAKRKGAFDWIRENMNKKDENGNKNQVFYICPFIEESENNATVKAAAVEFEYLKKEIFPEFNLGLLHGKMKPKEKDVILQDFRDQKIDLLVATPVVEVGIDIPNATIIVIEAAERFGLSQLHQLRGRVGRSSKQSYCLLFTESKSRHTLERLQSMEKIHIGAELAELDLRLRGPGDMHGTMQHGSKLLKIAHFSDFELIERAKQEAESIFENLSKHPKLKKKIEGLHSANISPD
jgi:ATP-dependent DNA helicase RecG